MHPQYLFFPEYVVGEGVSISLDSLVQGTVRIGKLEGLDLAACLASVKLMEAYRPRQRSGLLLVQPHANGNKQEASLQLHAVYKKQRPALVDVLWQGKQISDLPFSQFRDGIEYMNRAVSDLHCYFATTAWTGEDPFSLYRFWKLCEPELATRTIERRKVKYIHLIPV